jgi:transcription elongation factor GreA
MIAKSCLEIKNLEERLACLSEKYQELTDEIEKERESATSDETDSVFHISTQRQFIFKQMKLTQDRIRAEEKMKLEGGKHTKAEIGSRVILKNHTKSLDLRIVPEEEANPLEGLISLLSPIGEAIADRKVGEEVTVNLPSGSIPYVIENII